MPFMLVLFFHFVIKQFLIEDSHKRVRVVLDIPPHFFLAVPEFLHDRADDLLVQRLITQVHPRVEFRLRMLLVLNLIRKGGQPSSGNCGEA